MKPEPSIAIKSYVFATAIFVAWIATSQRPVIADEPLSGLNDYLSEAIREFQVPGASIAVVKDGRIAHLAGHGVQKLGTATKVTPDTLFPIASITKNFTATALALLVEEKKLRWDDRIVDHLPDFKFSDEYRTKHTTIRDILCHRTGLERGDLLPRRGGLTEEEIVRRVQYLQPVHGFREKWEYNNLMYYVAGAIVERVSGLKWNDYVLQKLCKPLKMSRTSTSWPSDGINDVAFLHRWVDNKILPVTRGKMHRGVSPAGSMQSTARDMSKWLLAVMAQNRNALGLNSGTRREMQSIQMSIPVTWDGRNNRYAAKFYGWGLGWTVLDFQGHKLVYHAGSTGAMFAFMPEQRIGVVILTNLDRTPLAGMLMYDVLDAYLSGSTVAWEHSKWDFWKKSEVHPDTRRKRELAKEDAKRIRPSPPSLPTDSFVGSYNSPLYGNVRVNKGDQQLLISYGFNPSISLQHWEANTFYARSPVPNDRYVDWLVSFEVSGQRVTAIQIKRLGWHEKLPKFVRVEIE